MWLFTPEGFYSIVDAGEFGEELMIRARDAADLDRLRNKYLPQLGPNFELAGRDYPVRAFTTRESLAQCLSEMAMALDYDNFKSEVAAQHSSERAAIYHDVWDACRKIQKATSRRTPVPTRSRVGAVEDRTSEYRTRDLHAEGEWPDSSKPRYGSVIFDSQGRILLREPSGHFDDYHWTFAKGATQPGEHPVDTALRETMEEMGRRPVIIGHIRGAFTGSRVGATAYYYMMMDSTGMVDVEAMQKNGETSDVVWATFSEAQELISRTTNVDGRARDLRTLDAAFNEWEARAVDA